MNERLLHARQCFYMRDLIESQQPWEVESIIIPINKGGNGHLKRLS